MFFKKKDKPAEPQTNQQEQNRIWAAVEKPFADKDYVGVETALAQFYPAELTEAEKEAWHHCYGMAAFQRYEREVAFQRFFEGLKQCPDSGNIAFSLGQEYEYKGYPDYMIDLFDRAIFPKVSATFSLAEARYAYLWNRPEKALTYIEPIFDAYFQLRILDDTFLIIRGLPMFSETFSCFAACCILMGNSGAVAEQLKQVRKKCSDEYGFDLIQAKVTGAASGDYAPLLNVLKINLPLYHKQNAPAGYPTLMQNILLAQASQDLDQAERILASTAFGEKDFPWLDDMRLLARCQLEYRRKNTDGEEMLIREFMNKQTLLFEPGHVFDFNLLDYQERLKPRYQATKKR